MPTGTDHRLTPDQKAALLEMIAADYGYNVIADRFEQEEWPPISAPLVTYYRQKHWPEIDRLKRTRYIEALSTGLAIKAERVKRLKEHADHLDSIRWQPDEHGRLWNERAWRETLHQIAEEMNQLRSVSEPKPMRDLLLERMHDAGLTLDDIAKDPITAELFRGAGIDIPGPATNGAHRRIETTRHSSSDNNKP